MYLNYKVLKSGENQMQTEIFKSYTKEQVEGEKHRLEAKYESIENLHQKFSVQKWRNPEFVDD